MPVEYNPFARMPPSRRLLDRMARDGVNTSRRAEVDAWVAAWRKAGYP